MRKLSPMLAVAVLFSAVSLLVRAGEGEKVTIEGKAQCAKCQLKETETCQNVVVTEDGEKYYLAPNDVARKAHKSMGFCSGEGRVKVEGMCEEKDGKLVLTATKIEKIEE